MIKLVKMKALWLHLHIMDVQTTAGTVLQSAGSEHLPLRQATAGHVDENRCVIFYNSDRRRGERIGRVIKAQFVFSQRVERQRKKYVALKKVATNPFQSKETPQVYRPRW